MLENPTKQNTKALDIGVDLATKDELDQEIQKNNFSELPTLPDGFYSNYYKHGESVMYAYPAYHFGNALALVSLAVGRRMVVRSSNSEFYPNIYVMCIGQTSTSGKSTACNLMSKKFYPLLHQQGITEKLSKKLTPQAFIQQLCEVPQRLWHYDECGEFFSDIRNRWAESLVGNMCAAYDGDSLSYALSKSKGKESEFLVERPFLTCVWNTTDSVIREQVQASEATNGFLPRWMWFWCYKEVVARPNHDQTPEEYKAEEAIKDDIRGLQDFFKKLGTETAASKLVPTNPTLDGIIRFKVQADIENWKMSSDQTEEAKGNEEYKIVSARLFPQAYKIAMLLTIMDKEFQSEVLKAESYPYVCDLPVKYAKLAIEICEKYLRPRSLAVLDYSKECDNKNIQIRIKKVLIRLGCHTNKGKLQREVHINTKPLMEALESMQDSGEIKLITVSTATKPRLEIVLLRNPEKQEVN